VVLVAVRDAQIDDALRELLEAPLAPDAVVLHASGSAEPAMLDQVRARYHAAAVIVSNFPAVLLATGDRVLAETGIPAEAAEQALRALFLAAIGNLRRQHGAVSLTGPILRGDVDTIRRHLVALADDPGALEVYRSLSRALVDLASDAGTDADRLQAIRAMLD